MCKHFYLELVLSKIVHLQEMQFSCRATRGSHLPALSLQKVGFHLPLSLDLNLPPLHKDEEVSKEKVQALRDLSVPWEVC